jgi:hypothetical protein
MTEQEILQSYGITPSENREEVFNALKALPFIDAYKCLIELNAAVNKAEDWNEIIVVPTEEFYWDRVRQLMEYIENEENNE